MVRQRKRKSERFSNPLNVSETNKLFSYLNRLNDCLKVIICTKKRVKPFQVNPTLDLHSNGKQMTTSVVRPEVSPKIKNQNKKSIDNIDLEKGIEECVEESTQRKTVESVPPEKSEPKTEELLNRLNAKNVSQVSPHFNENIESEEKANNLRTESNELISREKIYGNDIQLLTERNVTRIRPKTTSDIFNENEPIFKPLNQSFGQNGRMSRLSFTNRPDSGLYSGPRDIGLDAINANHVFIRYNNYNKIIANNVRLNPRNKRLYKTNQIQTNNTINRLEINSSVD